RARRGSAGEADVRPRALARLHRYRCGATDADGDEHRIAQSVAAFPLNAAPGVLEVPRHVAELALQLRIGAEPRHGCDDAHQPGETPDPWLSAVEPWQSSLPANRGSP